MKVNGTLDLTGRPESVYTEPMNTTTHTTQVIPTEPETMYKDGSYKIECSVCGCAAEYRGYEFTLVEARRHTRYFDSIATK